MVKMTEEIIARYKIIKDKKLRIFGDKFVENNKQNCKIKINKKIIELTTHLDYENILIEKEELEIKLIGINKITNMSYIFSECEFLISLPNISEWDTFNIINMNSIFSGCKSLTFISDISKWNISNVNNISYMFYECSSLNSLPD